MMPINKTQEEQDRLLFNHDANTKRYLLRKDHKPYKMAMYFLINHSIPKYSIAVYGDGSLSSQTYFTLDDIREQYKYYVNDGWVEVGKLI